MYLCCVGGFLLMGFKPQSVSSQWDNWFEFGNWAMDPDFYLGQLSSAF